MYFISTESRAARNIWHPANAETLLGVKRETSIRFKKVKNEAYYISEGGKTSDTSKIVSTKKPGKPWQDKGSERKGSSYRFAKYSAERNAQGFRQIKFFVHDDDRDELRRFSQRLNEERKRKLGIQ